MTPSPVVVECQRAVRRTANRRSVQRAQQVFDTVCLLDLTPVILERASTIEPAMVRSLDGIHLSTALSVDDHDLEVITSDERMAEAARASGLRVTPPGRTGKPGR